MRWVPSLRAAWADALYGEHGRFTVGGRDFSTALTDPVSAPVLCAALARLARRVDECLGHPDPYDVVDLGAGTGSFLSFLAADPETPARWRLTGVELSPRPPLDARIRWAAALPDLTGLLLAHEWLDNVPCEVLLDGLVLRSDGSSGPVPGREDERWLERWWPGWRTGPAECGRARDEAWAAAVSHVARGAAVAIDYGHTSSERRPTLTGYRDGRQVPPALDGTGDVTAHVALDAVAAAVGATLHTQRESLRELGLHGTVEHPVTAAGLQAASGAATLLDPAGYGAYGWITTIRR